MFKKLAFYILSRVMSHQTWARMRGAEIGLNCKIYSNLGSSGEPWLIKIGNNVTISADVRLVTHDGSGVLVSDSHGRRYRYGRVEIGDNVFIGIGSIIMPGVTIGDFVVVGAGSVVTKDVVSNTIIAGVPAKPISTFEEFEKKARLWPTESQIKSKKYRQRVQYCLDFKTDE